MRFPKPYADFVQRFRVPGGFVLLAAFAVLSQPTWRSILSGLPLCALGMAIRAWAAGHLAKNEQLAQSGPYAYVRNPLYVGSLIVTAGMILAARNPLLAVLFTAAFLLIYLPVMQQESDHLTKLFPGYADYARRVPLVIPRLTPAGEQRAFRADLYKRNKEWKALSGLLLGLVLLALKAQA